MQYIVIIENEPHSDWGAYVPDLPGCIATASSRHQVERLIREAIEFHLQGMRLHGETIPEPKSTAVLVEIPA